MEVPRYERRIGKRLLVDPVSTAVDVETQGLFRRRVVTFECELVEVSITGAKLVGPAADVLTPGATVRLRIAGAGAATAVIRRRSGEEHVAYGVEVLAADAELMAFVSRRVADNRGDLELAWRLAR